MRTLLLALVLLTPAAAAQSTGPVSERGDTAMLFSFGGFGFGTGSYLGGVGVKRWVSETAALTAGVQLGASSNEATATDSTPGDIVRSESSRTSLGLDLGAEFHSPGGRVSPFVGIGLGAGVRSNQSLTEFDNGQDGEVDESESDEVFLQAGVGVGAEFWVTPQLSLSAQQRLGATYSTGTERRVRNRFGADQDTELDVSGYNVGLGATSLTLSVYF